MIENLQPQQAWELLQHDPEAVLIDVRTSMERQFVGYPPGSIHVPWKEMPDWQINTSFIAHVQQAAPQPDAPVLLLCRSGQRSLDAAKALEAVGYRLLVNIIDGFEGPLDHHSQRGNLGGWRFQNLPWQQS